MKPELTSSPDDALDRLLREHFQEDHAPLQPSSGFTGTVMEAIASEARSSATLPIPFPWRRFLPAAGGAVLLLVAFAVVLLLRNHNAQSSALDSFALPLHITAQEEGLCWLLASLLASALAFFGSMRIANRR